VLGHDNKENRGNRVLKMGRATGRVEFKADPKPCLFSKKSTPRGDAQNINCAPGFFFDSRKESNCIFRGLMGVSPKEKARIFTASKPQF
jgi:hypothetical protein